MACLASACGHAALHAERGTTTIDERTQRPGCFFRSCQIASLTLSMCPLPVRLRACRRWNTRGCPSVTESLGGLWRLNEGGVLGHVSYYLSWSAGWSSRSPFPQGGGRFHATSYRFTKPQEVLHVPGVNGLRFGFQRTMSKDSVIDGAPGDAEGR